jgi:diguanylate cyclase (GGDEF)-like protein/PAS domain S-box-containing protein
LTIRRRKRSEVDTPLKLLLVAGRESDARTVLRDLRRDGFAPEPTIVDTEAATRTALARGPWDVMLCLQPLVCNAAAAVVAARGGLLPPIVCLPEPEGAPCALPEGVHVETVGTGTATLAGAVRRAVLFTAERHARRRQEDEAARVSRLFDAVAAGLEEGVYVHDRGGRVTFLNPAAERLLGWSHADLQGQVLHDLVHDHANGSSTRADLCPLATVLQAEAPVQAAEDHFRRRDGATLPVSYTATPLAVDSFSAAVVAFRDLTERKRMERELLFRAFRDPLTGLPNMALFRDRLSQALLRTARPVGRVAVIMLDVDRFRVINNSLGHTVGDQLLIEISSRLTASVGPDTVIARFGGDLFTILLEQLTRRADATALAERLIEELRAPFLLYGREVFITASAGIAFGAPQQAQPGDLLRDADTALHRAKAVGRARHAVFDPRQGTPALKRLEREAELWRALQREEIQVHYQPTVDLSTGAIVGAEALARWRHPRHGSISPSEFIPLAEEMELMVSIGRWVLEQACRQMRAWRSQFAEHRLLQVSVNLSAKEFQHPDLLRQVAGVLRRTELESNALVLEITEGILMEDAPGTLRTLRALKRLGVQLAIDDFGTGYSSLSYLRRFPVDMVKIDRSLVKPLRNNRRSTAIVRAVTLLAHDLGMAVTAEGIETPLQLACLRDVGCDLGQGFHFSRAMPAEEVTAALSADGPDVRRVE